jgi:hypothetical protein
MNVCPNISLDDWKALEKAVGKYEAFKDYVESGYQIRSVEEVQAKLESQKERENNRPEPLPHTEGLMSGIPTDVALALFHASDRDTNDMIQEVVRDSANTRAYEIARKLSDGLGVKFNIITAERAKELTNGSINPWNGQAAFYFNGQVFFVGDSLSINSVFHEFAHPLVRQIIVDNPTLFNKLYDDLISTPEGQLIVEKINKSHPQLSKDGPMFREEVVVSAIEHAALKQSQSSNFMKFMKNLFYSIKKFLRGKFGKIDVSQLSPSTTLDQLAMMLTNENFKIDTELVTEKDVVAYLKDFQDEINDMKRIDKTELQALIYEGYQLAAEQLRTLQKDGNYKQLAIILRDQYKRPDMEIILQDLSKYKSKLDNIVDNEIEAMELLQSQANAMVNTIYNVDTIIGKIQLHMDDLYKSGDSQSNLQKISYYRKLTDHWGKYIAQVKDVFNKPGSGVPADSKIMQVIKKIETNLEKIDNVTDEVYADGTRDIIYQEFELIGRDAKERYEKIISDLEAKGAPAKVIDRWYKEYHGLTKNDYAQFNTLRQKVRNKEYMSNAEKLQYANMRIAAGQGIEITPEKIEDLLKGQLNDSSWFNGFFEGYMYNNDPIVGGLALYVKNNMNEVMVNAQSKLNDFSNDLKDSLEAYGYNPRNIGELGQKVGFLDEILSEDENGNKVKRKIWTLLNPFKNYRHDLQVINNEVEEAEREFSTTNSDDSLVKLRDVISRRKEFLRKYFYQEYKSEFYERQSLFEQDDIGKIAAYKRDNIIERIRQVSATATSEIEQQQIAKQIDLLWREYRQLHSLYDLYGNKKTGNDLAIAERLREYRNKSRKYYEWKERPGVFQQILSNYEDELASKYGVGSPEYRDLREQWIRKNTRVVIKQSWYNRRQEIFARIKEIMDTLPNAEAKELDISALHEAIIDIKSGFRDEDGQPDPSEITPAAIKKIKELELEISERKRKYEQGLDADDQTELNNLFKIRDTRSLTKVEQDRLNVLYARKKAYSLDSYLRSELNSLYAQLEEMSSTEATGYYVDIVNNFLQLMDTDIVQKALGSRTITEQSANRLLDPEVIQALKKQSSEFAKWFDDNHTTIEKYGNTYIKRVSIWSVVRPTDPSDYEQTEIKDKQGKVIEKISGLPAMKFYKQEVKEEYKNAQIVGKTIDNKGNWLPKSAEDLDQSLPDWDKYINKDYFALKESDPKLFTILEKLTEHHLRNQNGLDNKSKLYLDFPRFTRPRGVFLGLGLETIQSTKIDEEGKRKWSGIQQWVKRVKEFFTGSTDQAEDGFNNKWENNLVTMSKLDLFDSKESNIPISGLYNIDHEDVSTDIITSMMRYMYSGERQKQLIKISPIARAIQKVVNDPKNNKDLNTLNKNNFIHRHIITYKQQTGISVRASQVNNFIEREFEGVNMKGPFSESAFVNNLSSALFNRASFQFFALNIPSALKNQWSAKFQSMIEASAGKYMNGISAAKGEAWAVQAMGDLSFGGNLYTKGPKSLTQQIIEIFDPVQGRFEEKLRNNTMSRSVTKDIVEGSWLYSTRKWLELQATLQQFGGMMHHMMIDRTLPNGTVEKIPYIEAFELDENNKIRLKSGIDPKYGFTINEDGSIKLGREFNHFKNKMQQVINSLNGAYSEYDQPEAQRYILFRFMSYLRRYFTTMAIKRWGFKGPLWSPSPRLNPGLGEPDMGYYIRTAQMVGQMVKNADFALKYATPEEKQAAMRALTEVAGLIIIGLVLSMIFGWDPDDEERYEKLRKLSGPLDFFGVEEDASRPFNTVGYLETHLINLLMQVRAENEQFIPLPSATPYVGGGLYNYLDLLDLKSVVFGPTTDTYRQILDDMIHIAKGDDQAYYSRDTGPYYFQQEGGSKLVAKIAKLLGFTGSTIDPAMAIQKFHNAQAMARR